MNKYIRHLEFQTNPKPNQAHHSGMGYGMHGPSYGMGMGQKNKQKMGRFMREIQINTKPHY